MSHTFSFPILLFLCFGLALTACKKEVVLDDNDLIDERDGTRYSTVIIGDQRWMAENLIYKMPNAHYNSNNPFSEYGRLYNYEDALVACPKGWHLPSEQEWYRLERYIGIGAAELSSVGYRGGSVGNALKSNTGWVLNNGSNNLLFNAYPAGYFEQQSGDFLDLGREAYFWTATEIRSGFSWYRGLTKSFDGVYRDTKRQRDALSCRCVEDE